MPTSTSVNSAYSLPPGIAIEAVESFVEHLRKSKRIVALLGAGLSASSGLATFRGAGGNTHRICSSVFSLIHAFLRAMAATRRDATRDA
jgi:hypothetical protein